MNTHKHARLTYARRLEVVKQMTESGVSACDAARQHGVTPPTARKWLGRFLAAGEAGLADASSRPARSPRTIEPGKALLIVELRKRRMLQARIARSVGVCESTVSRVLSRAGLSKLSDLDPKEPLVRYEHEAPGDLLHIDTKKLGRIVRPSHRVTGNRKDSTNGAGWEMLFVAIDDHASVAFTAMHPDEKTPQAVQFSADQWQGRAVHPIGSPGVGLWLDLPELSSAQAGAGQLATSLQLPSSAQRHRRLPAHL